MPWCGYDSSGLTCRAPMQGARTDWDPFEGCHALHTPPVSVLLPPVLSAGVGSNGSVTVLSLKRRLTARSAKADPDNLIERDGPGPDSALDGRASWGLSGQLRRTSCGAAPAGCAAASHAWLFCGTSPRRAPPVIQRPASCKRSTTCQQSSLSQTCCRHISIALWDPHRAGCSSGPTASPIFAV